MIISSIIQGGPGSNPTTVKQSDEIKRAGNHLRRWRRVGTKVPRKVSFPDEVLGAEVALKQLHIGVVRQPVPHQQRRLIKRLGTPFAAVRLFLDSCCLPVCWRTL